MKISTHVLKSSSQKYRITERSTSELQLPKDVSGSDLEPRSTSEHSSNGRGSIPAKVGFWVGLRIFPYVPTPTKITNAISKMELLGPKKGMFLPKRPLMWSFFVFGLL